jgi:hypothetical protein
VAKPKWPDRILLTVVQRRVVCLRGATVILTLWNCFCAHSKNWQGFKDILVAVAVHLAVAVAVAAVAVVAAGAAAAEAAAEAFLRRHSIRARLLALTHRWQN